MNNQNLELAVQLRHDLHEHPELSNEETWTKQYVMDFLKAHTTNFEVIDKGNWFYAAYRVDPNKPNIAFRADFDALPMNEVIDLPWASRFPGKAHKCGHDGHTATLCAFALEIDQYGADQNIFCLFQPAEETGDGAIQCISLIEEEKIDEIYAYHNMSGIPAHTVVVKDGTMLCASKGMTIHLQGSPAHASQPEKGRNPSLAIANIITKIPEFTSIEKNEGLILSTVVQIDVGEKAFGMSASKGTLRLTIRALYENELNRLQENLENFAEMQAKEHGLQVTFAYQDEFPETANDKECSDTIRKTATANAMEIYELPEAYRGSEDFGHLSKRTKGAYCFIGNGVDYPHVHTSEYDFNDELIKTGVTLFKGIITSKSLSIQK